MNCKPGDLVVCVRSQAVPVMVGRVFRVVDGVWGDHWKTHPEQIDPADGRIVYFQDCTLRPIRDSDGEDEMIRIAGKPREKVEG